MTMVSSGAVSFGGASTTSPLRNSINIELLNSATATLAMNNSAFRTLAGKPTGAVAISDVYGKTYTRYGTPSGSFTFVNSTTWNVNLAISNGMPNASFYIEVTFTTSGQPYPGYIDVTGSGGSVGALDSNGNWSRTYNVYTPDPSYWSPRPQTNYFDFYQGPVGGGIGSGVKIGTVVLSS